MEENQIERLVVAFERIAEAQEQQADYLNQMLAEHSAYYANASERYQKLANDEAQMIAFRERDIEIAERRIKLDFALWRLKFAHAAFEDDMPDDLLDILGIRK